MPTQNDQEPWERRLLDAIMDANSAAVQAWEAMRGRRRLPLNARNLEAHLWTLERHVRELRERWERLR